MKTVTNSKIESLISGETLPETFMQVVADVYRPISNHLIKRFPSSTTTHIIGINGCPGSGKSTMALFLKVLLEEEYNRSVEILSIDDFYNTKAERQDLATKIHPLLITRGVPGTHDIDLANSTLDALCTDDSQLEYRIPRFNKATDDRHPAKEWPLVSRTPNFIILEGWCVGAAPQESSLLGKAINSLEDNFDKGAVWRTYVNMQLTDSYQSLFNRLDFLIVLSPPNPEIVFKWRIEQEKKLRERVKGSQNKDHACGMTDEQLATFVMHYQRLVEHMHSELPLRSNIVVNLDQDRTVLDLNINSSD